ncbi:hypothetical protein EDC04DRAFT_2608989 [Pisolithus marmoratus]|nr:hypothetical protein EDC04DRAFT_2608989 [Pisolithus marmoratus]
MSSMGQLAGLAAGLIWHTLKLSKAWEVNDDLQARSRTSARNWEKLPTPPFPLSLHPPSLLTSNLLMISSVLKLHPSVVYPTMTNLALVEQPADRKGKQRQPLPPQVEPACPPMEDEITPGKLYADHPGNYVLVLCLGQGNDGIRLVLFMRINNNLYAYGDKMIRKVIRNMNKGVPPPVLTHRQPVGQAIQWERDMMGPIILYNTAEEICKLNGGHPFGPPRNHLGDLPQISTRDPWSHLNCKEGLAPLEKKARGAVPELPLGAPSIYAPVNDWVKFIHQYQNQSDDFDESSKLSRMFPGALCFSPHPDDDEAEVNPPSQQDVQGFLLYEQLVLVSRRDHDWNIWLCKLIKLLAVKGQCRAFLEWAEVTPTIGTPVLWEGGFTCSATMADVATYLAANGIMYHDADNALQWAWRVGNDNGGDKDPNTKAIVNQMRATLNELLPIGSCVGGSHHTRGEGNDAGGVLLISAETLKEGEMEDDSRLM